MADKKYHELSTSSKQIHNAKFLEKFFGMHPYDVLSNGHQMAYRERFMAGALTDTQLEWASIDKHAFNIAKREKNNKKALEQLWKDSPKTWKPDYSNFTAKISRDDEYTGPVNMRELYFSFMEPMRKIYGKYVDSAYFDMHPAERTFVKKWFTKGADDGGLFFRRLIKLSTGKGIKDLYSKELFDKVYNACIEIFDRYKKVAAMNGYDDTPILEQQEKLSSINGKLDEEGSQHILSGAVDFARQTQYDQYAYNSRASVLAEFEEVAKNATDEVSLIKKTARKFLRHAGAIAIASKEDQSSLEYAFRELIDDPQKNINSTEIRTLFNTAFEKAKGGSELWSVSDYREMHQIDAIVHEHRDDNKYDTIIETRFTPENATLFLTEIRDGPKIHKLFLEDAVVSAKLPAKYLDAIKYGIKQNELDSKDSINRLPPLPNDPQTWWQQFAEWAEFKFPPTRMFLNDDYLKRNLHHKKRQKLDIVPRLILDAISAEKIDTVKGLDGLIEKDGEAIANRLPAGTDPDAFLEWGKMVKRLKKAKETMPNVFKEALYDGRKMRSLIEFINVDSLEDFFFGSTPGHRWVENMQTVLYTLSFDPTDSAKKEEYGKVKFDLMDTKEMKTDGGKILAHTVNFVSNLTKDMVIGLGRYTINKIRNGNWRKKFDPKTSKERAAGQLKSSRTTEGRFIEDEEKLALARLEVVYQEDLVKLEKERDEKIDKIKEQEKAVREKNKQVEAFKNDKQKRDDVKKARSKINLLKNAKKQLIKSSQEEIKALRSMKKSPGIKDPVDKLVYDELLEAEGHKISEARDEIAKLEAHKEQINDEFKAKSTYLEFEFLVDAGIYAEYEYRKAKREKQFENDKAEIESKQKSKKEEFEKSSAALKARGETPEGEYYEIFDYKEYFRKKDPKGKDYSKMTVTEGKIMRLMELEAHWNFLNGGGITSYGFNSVREEAVQFYARKSELNKDRTDTKLVEGSSEFEKKLATYRAQFMSQVGDVKAA